MRFRLGFEWFVIQRGAAEAGCRAGRRQLAATPTRRSTSSTTAARRAWPATTATLPHGPSTISGCSSPSATTTPVTRTTSCCAAHRHRFGPMRPSLVLYTSGTTGAEGRPLDLSGADFERLARYGASVGGVPPIRTRRRARDDACPPRRGAAVATGACASGEPQCLDPYDPEEALRSSIVTRCSCGSVSRRCCCASRRCPKTKSSGMTFLRSRRSPSAAPVPQSLKQWIVEHFARCCGRATARVSPGW